jgi:hypothetical protein
MSTAMTRFYIILYRLLPAFLLLLPASAEDLPLQKQMREKFILEMTKIDAAIAERKTGIDKFYVEALIGLLDKNRKAGNLEGHNEIKAELERFEKDMKPPADRPEDTSRILSALQESYGFKLDKLKTERARQIVDMTKKYEAALERLLKKLVLEDRIDEAVAIRQELGKIATNRALVSARERVEADRPPELTGTPAGGARGGGQGNPRLLPGREGVATLKYSDKLEAWFKPENQRYRPGATQVDLQTEPPERSWLQPRKEKDEKARFYASIPFGEKNRVNVIQQVGRHEDLSGWFSFGKDISFASKKKFSFRTPRLKGTRVRELPQLLNFPMIYPNGDGHYQTIEIRMDDRILAYTSAYVMEGTVNLGGATHELALFDQSGKGNFTQYKTLVVYLKNAYTGELIRTLKGYPFTINDKPFQLVSASPSGQEARFEPCAMTRITGKIINRSNLQPLAGASIVFPAIDKTIVTDVDGRFEEEIPHGNYDPMIITMDRFVPWITRLSSFGEKGLVLKNVDEINQINADLAPGTFPVAGEVTIRNHESFRFLTGTRERHKSSGDFNFSVYSERASNARFHTHDSRQLGMAQIGETKRPLHAVDPSAYTFNKEQLPVLVGHTYVAKARMGELNHFIVFKVTNLDPVGGSVQLQYLYQ